MGIECFGCGIFVMWDIQDVRCMRCSGCGMFEMWTFWICDVERLRLLFLGCGIFGRWVVADLGNWGCEMLGIGFRGC